MSNIAPGVQCWAKVRVPAVVQDKPGELLTFDLPCQIDAGHSGDHMARHHINSREIWFP